MLVRFDTYILHYKLKILTDIIAYGPVVLRSSLVTMEIGRTEIATANAKIVTVF